MKKTATISECNKYRYDLFRIWDETKPYLMFIGLNPSTADHELDDPTIKRCIGFAEKLDFGGVCMCNLYALRATNPSAMMSSESPIGSDNDMYVKKHALSAGMVIAAWGNHGCYLNRDKEILDILNVDVFALDINKSGQPKHPLYIHSDNEPKIYRPKNR
ncbi:MAG: DUF1643 domain-containing protein [Providencia rustigianii]|uniref:DUF1643 domain-containing protein n=1 Tax=Providencia rustigianii TaxID=158850 RepID=UPI003F35753E